ncbi:MAG: diacylglycerol kinase family protein [Verrucomicrobiales bacterium]|nr:diacylglycerol kinase family protein [Verrucomicrobiales bacterium]
MSDMRQARKLWLAFADAGRGFCIAIRSERNLRIHLCVAAIVVVSGFVLDVSSLEWVALVFCIGLVITVEMLNSALEYLADTVHPEMDAGIRNAKDVAAGAVLIAVLAAVVVGVIIFLPKLWEIAKQLESGTGSTS